MSRDMVSYIREAVSNLGQRIHRLETLEQEPERLIQTVPIADGPVFTSYTTINGLAWTLTSGVWLVQISMVVRAQDNLAIGTNVFFRLMQNGAYVFATPTGRLVVGGTDVYTSGVQFWKVTVPPETTTLIEVEVIKESPTGNVDLIGDPSGDTQMLVYRLSSGTV